MGITIMPYTPLKTAKNEPEVIEVASKMGVTSAQIALRFFTQTNHPVLTFSQSAEHMKQNLKSSRSRSPLGTWKRWRPDHRE